MERYKIHEYVTRAGVEPRHRHQRPRFIPLACIAAWALYPCGNFFDTSREPVDAIDTLPQAQARLNYRADCMRLGRGIAKRLTKRRRLNRRARRFGLMRST